jgi:hypothetical protein
MQILMGQIRKILSAERLTKENNEQGFVLITVILFLAVFMILSFTLLYKITSTIKISGITKMGLVRFHGAEGGALSVASYMAKYKETNVPLDVLETENYRVVATPLGDTIRYPVGYSTMWKGVTVKINSVSKPVESSEVEMVVFVPVSPVGYGNE